MRGFMRHAARSRVLAAAIGAVAMAAIGSVAYATIPDGGGVIHACYGGSGSALRVIDDSVTNCKKSETALSWNEQGPAGPAGPQGDPGPQGPQGPPGAVAAREVSETIGGPLSNSLPPQLLASLDLPAGSWALFAKVRLQNDSSAEYAASCRLILDVDRDATSTLESVATQGQQTSSQVQTLMGLATIASPGTAELRCNDTTAQPARWSNAKIVAVQVSTILP